MTGPFKAPEIATTHGALDDAAFADGQPLSAHAQRTMIRSGNRLASRGHLVFRHVERSDPGEESPGYGEVWAYPFWALAIPRVMPYPVEKAYGLTKLRQAVRIAATADMTVQLVLTTSHASRLTPDLVEKADSILYLGAGIDTIELATQEDVLCRRFRGESLGFYLRAVCDDATDPALDTGTFGGVATGTAIAFESDHFWCTGAQWNINGGNVGASYARYGHRVVFKDLSGAVLHNAMVIGPGPATGAGRSDSMFFTPSVDPNVINGSTFSIFQLPLVRVVSWVVYAQDREA